MQKNADSRKPGRPRDPALERRILEITLRRLSKEGYSRMSIGGIAGEAGVSKPTIYRRWTDKADLATAAIAALRLAEPKAPKRSTLDGLRAELTNFRNSLLRPNGMSLIGTVLEEEHHTPDLLRLFRERIVEPRRQALRAILLAAGKNGELRPDADIEVAVTMLIGSFYARYLAGSAVPADWPARVARLVWGALTRT